MNWQDVSVALLSLLDVASGAVLAITFGFMLFPSALGFIVGAVGSLLTGNITPVSFQQEGLSLAKGLGKDLRERVSMILFAAALTGILGLLGLPQMVVDKIGPEIFLAMLAGVGLYLTKVGLDLSKDNLIIGIPCAIVALVVQIVTNNLIYAVTASVPLGILIQWILVKTGRGKPATEVEVPHYSNWWEGIKAEFKVIKPAVTWSVIIGTLALATLTIGGNIAYTAVNLSMATNPVQAYNQVTVISGLADFASSLFGGASMEVIVSATAAAPHPILAGALLMFGAAIVLLSGLIYKIAKYIPIAAMGGYLIAIGMILVLPYNAADAFSAGNPIVVSVTIAATALTNPFFGLVAGLLTKLALGLLGML
jgi:AGZA family xanthine/uracil permease-like MFS transporter